MKASYYNRFGSCEVLAYGDIAKPRPKVGEVLVKVHAAALNPKDVLVRKGKFKLMSGTQFPRVSGYDFAGVVEALGGNCDGMAVGTRVFGMLNRWSGGSCAEYLSAPLDELTELPDALDMQRGAALPLVGLTALQALRDSLQLRAGEAVLINGASGGVGTVALQIAAAMGATTTAVCSRRNEALVRSLGAGEVIAYDETDPLAQPARFDAFFDVFGNAPYSRAKRVLRAAGRFVTTVPRAASVGRELLARAGLSRARLVVVQSRRSDLEQLSRWAVEGKLRAVIDRVLPLEDAAEGHLHLESKRARGKVVLAIADDARTGAG